MASPKFLSFIISTILLQLTSKSYQEALTLASGGRSQCDQNATRVRSADQLRLLRYKLDHDQLGGYLIPATDSHLSPFPAEHDRRLRYMTGFSGSYGLAIVLNNNMSVLITDSRYAEQADEQLSCDWQLLISGNLISGALSWLKVNSERGAKIAADARLIGHKDVSYCNLFEHGAISLILYTFGCSGTNSTRSLRRAAYD